MKEFKAKPILDACCGSKMMWFNKNNPDVVFNDVRKEQHTLCDGRLLDISPDTNHDFRNLPFPDNSFKLVVFDPPHLKNLGKSSYMAKKYGVLGYTLEMDIKEGFSECMRVLEPWGVLIFKWNEYQIKTAQIKKLLPIEPLFGQTTKNNGHTIWMTFMKKNN
jgi:ubiquinone/menaquinone biosynthesis C-methylase UbiE